MDHMATQRYIVASCLLLLALLFAGCSASSLGSQVDYVVTPVIVRDPAPGVLEISMWVRINQQAVDADMMVDAGLSFLSGGHTIQFAGDERVTCDGVDLPLKNRAATFQVFHASAAQAAGATIRCDYAAGGSVSGISLQIPAAPEITFPQMGAQVVRSARTLVTYRCDPATCAMLGVVALAGFPSATGKAVAALNTPSPLQATVDTSAFARGPGSLALTANLSPHLTETGAPFKSVRVGGGVTAMMTVTWI